MNERISQTTAGMFAKMKSSLELVAIEFGTALLPKANEFLQVLLDSMPEITSFATSIADGLLSAIDWFTWTQSELAKLGIALGVIAGNFTTVWEAAWNDVSDVASQALKWMRENTMEVVGILAEVAATLANPVDLAYNIATKGKPFDVELPPILDPNFVSQAGRAVADVAAEIAAAQNQYEQETAAATAKKLADEKERLAAQEAARAAARNAPPEAFPEGPPLKKAADDTLKQAQQEMAKAQIERGSAASIFTSIADKLANKAMEDLAKAQLAAQQEANKIATQTLQAISILPFGLQ